MCEQILKKDSAPIQFKFFELLKTTMSPIIASIASRLLKRTKNKKIDLRVDFKTHVGKGLKTRKTKQLKRRTNCRTLTEKSLSKMQFSNITD